MFFRNFISQFYLAIFYLAKSQRRKVLKHTFCVFSWDFKSSLKFSIRTICDFASLREI